MNNGGRTEHARGIPIRPRDANNALAFFTSAPSDKDPSSSGDELSHKSSKINRVAKHSGRMVKERET